MPTAAELLRALLAPVLVAGVIAGLGWWRRWAWAMPLAAGAGFLTGYALLGVPRLPPRDGNDWLFWLTIPLTALAAMDAIFRWRGGWALGAFAGVISIVVLRPLMPASVSPAMAWSCAVAMAATAGLLTRILSLLEKRLPTPAVVAGLCIVIGGAGVVVLSSNVRSVGIDGMAASAALGPVAVFSGRVRSARAVAILALSILAGLLVGGHFYADAGGVTWLQIVLLMAAPALLAVGVALPLRHAWHRGAIAVLAVAILTAIVTVPAARKAKKAAEEDPYGASSSMNATTPLALYAAV